MLMKRRIISVIGVCILVIAAAFVIRYAMKTPAVRKGADVAVVQSHLPATAPAPSKQNVSQALKEEIDHLRHVADSDTGDSEAALELARLLQDSHDTRDAVRYYSRALRFDPANNAARIDYSKCLAELGRSTEALRQCMIVLRKDSGNAEALFNIGALYGNTGVRDSAKAHWRRLIARHPEHELASRARENLKVLEGSSPSL